MPIFLVEILDHIFNYLDFKSKIKCRRINKQFLKYVDSYLKVKRFSLSSDYLHLLDCENIDTDLVINNLDFVLEPNIGSLILKSTFFKSTVFLRKISDLGIYHLNCDAVQAVLNHFKQISRLSIGFVTNDGSSHKINIDMQQLDELSLIFLEVQISIDSPKLKTLKLKLNQKETLEFKIDTLNSIENLELYYRPSNFLDHMPFLTNLKTLRFVQIESSNLRFIVQYFSGLKKLEQVSKPEIYVNDHVLINSIWENGLNNYSKVYYCDVNTFKSREKIKELRFRSLLELYVKEQHSSADKILTLATIDYSKIEPFYLELDNSRLFLRRFVRLSKIMVTDEIKDESHFLRFLKECDLFKCLLIYSTNFSNDLIYKLSLVCGFISELSIGHYFCSYRKIECTDDDLKAFLKFSDLKILRTTKEFSLSQIKCLFATLKHLKILEYSDQVHHIISISKDKVTYAQVFSNLEENIFNFTTLKTLFAFLDGKIAESDFSLLYNQLTGKMEFCLNK